MLHLADSTPPQPQSAGGEPWCDNVFESVTWSNSTPGHANVASTPRGSHTISHRRAPCAAAAHLEPGSGPRAAPLPLRALGQATRAARSSRHSTIMEHGARKIICRVNVHGASVRLEAETVCARVRFPGSIFSVRLPICLFFDHDQDYRLPDSSMTGWLPLFRLLEVCESQAGPVSRVLPPL